MSVQGDLVPIVKPRTLERAVIHSKPGYADDVKIGERRRAKSGDVSRVGWYLGFEKSDVEHQPASSSSGSTKFLQNCFQTVF